MHILDAKIHEFLERAKNGEIELEKDFIREFMDSSKRALVRQFSKKEPFRLRMSNIGRPFCQLWMEANGVEGENPSHYLIRNLYGDIVEAIVVFILKSIGVLVAEQVPVSMEIGGQKIDGTLDLILDINSDGEQSIWDIKSQASSIFQQDKTFEDIANDDPFGYVGQLITYSRAAKISPGGWIFVDKSTGEIRVTRFPWVDSPTKESDFGRFARTIVSINNRLPFTRDFKDVPETHYKRTTGNRILQGICKLCPYKFPCWPGLKPLRNVNSQSDNAELRYYTYLKEHNNGTNITEENGISNGSL